MYVNKQRGCCTEAVIFPNLDTRDVELTFILILTLTCVPFKYLWDFPALGASVKYLCFNSFLSTLYYLKSKKIRQIHICYKFNGIIKVHQSSKYMSMHLKILNNNCNLQLEYIISFQIYMYIVQYLYSLVLCCFY